LLNNALDAETTKKCEYGRHNSISQGSIGVRKVRLEEGDWSPGKSFRARQLGFEGITISGIYRHDRDCVGAPIADAGMFFNPSR